MESEKNIFESNTTPREAYVPKDEKQKRVRELCWTTQKKDTIYIETIAPHPSSSSSFFIPIGTNGTHCFALELLKKPSDDYQSVLLTNEAYGTYQALRHLGNADKILASIKMTDEKLYEAIPTLNRDKIVANQQKNKKQQQQQQNRVTFSGEIGEKVGEDVEKFGENKEKIGEKGGEACGDKSSHAFPFSILCCKLSDRNPKWKLCETQEQLFMVPHSIPLACSNGSYFVVIHCTTLTNVCVTVFPIIARGISKKYSFQHLIPIQLSGGVPHVSLSQEPGTAILSIACGKQVLVVDTLNMTKTKCLYEVAAESVATCAQVFESDETLIIGTSIGECISYKWKTGTPQLRYAVKGREPITSISRVDGIVCAQTCLGVTHFQSEVPIYKTMGRVLGHSVCGSLVFCLQKDGMLHVMSFDTDNVAWPFKIPTDPFSIECTPCAYQCVHSEPERVVTMYPNGLIRVIKIKLDIVRKITEIK